MEKQADTLEWPLTAKARIARGKFYNKDKADEVYSAVRFTDRKTGRYFYDLYINDEIYLTRVNPLFLEFVEFG